MDFLNKPMSEVWKATKRTLAEIMDNNEGVRTPSTSGQHHSYSPGMKPDSEPSGPSQPVGSSGRKARSSLGHNRGCHRSLDSELQGADQEVERENRPMDCNDSALGVVKVSTISGSRGQHSTSAGSLDFAEVQKHHNMGEQEIRSIPKIKGKDKQSSDRDRTKNAWAKFRLGYLGKSGTSQDVDDNSGGSAEKSPVLPSRLEKTSPTYTANSNAGSPGKSKLGSRASRRSRGEIGVKGFDFKSRFRSNSSDRATMRRREREEREKTRRSSYTRSSSFEVTEDVADEVNDAGENNAEDQADKVKTKLMSMWNNVKYGWTVKTKTSFSIHKPIWFLGKCYHQRPEDPDPERPPGMDSVRSMVIEMFKQDFSSRLWMTYRREFPTLAGSNFTSDCGWGCMLRSGQMLLAHSLILHFLGREWNVYKQQTQEMLQFHRQIIRWFGDQPLDMSPFSVHRLVSIGQHNGKKVGDWYGPASVAHIVKEAMDTANELNPLLGELCVYVAQDCTVYKKDVIDLCRSRSKKQLRPVYKDVPNEGTTQVDGSPPTSQSTSGVNQGEGSLRTDPTATATTTTTTTKELRQSTSSEEGATRIGSRLARSHERVFSMYGGGSLEAGTTAGTSPHTPPQGHTLSTSTSHLEDGRQGPGFRPGPSGLEALTGHGEMSSSLPARTSFLYPDTPRNSMEVKALPPTIDKEGLQGAANPAGSDSSRVRTGDITEVMAERTGDSPEHSIEMKDLSTVDYYPDEDNEEFDLGDDGERTKSGSSGNPCLSQFTIPKDFLPEAQPPMSLDGETSNSHQAHPHKSSPAPTDPHPDSTPSSSTDDPCQESTAPPSDPARSRSPSGSTDPKKPWCAVIVLIPVRLGGDEVNPVYIRPIQSLFTLESCLGIIGGKPKHSLYFVGFQEEKLIHLDPHYCQQVVDMRARDFPMWSFHCMSPRKMSITKMDPSCTIGFYIRTEDEFEQLCRELPTVVSPLGSHASDYPMFIVRDGRCGDWHNKNTNTNRPERYLRVRHVDENGRLVAPVKESEDFVLLDS